MQSTVNHRYASLLLHTIRCYLILNLTNQSGDTRLLIILELILLISFQDPPANKQRPDSQPWSTAQWHQSRSQTASPISVLYRYEFVFSPVHHYEILLIHFFPAETARLQTLSQGPHPANAIHMMRRQGNSRCRVFINKYLCIFNFIIGTSYYRILYLSNYSTFRVLRVHLFTSLHNVQAVYRFYMHCTMIVLEIYIYI